MQSRNFYLANDLSNLGTTKIEGARYVDIEGYSFHFTTASGQDVAIPVNPMRRDVSYGPQDHIWPPTEFFKNNFDAQETKLPGGGTSYRPFGLLQPFSFYSVESIDTYFAKTAASSDVLTKLKTRQDFAQYYKNHNTPDNSTNAAKALLQAEVLYSREKGFLSYIVHDSAAQGFRTNTLYNLGFEIVQFLSDSELLVSDSLNDQSILYVHQIDSARMSKMESEYRQYGSLMSNAFLVVGILKTFGTGGLSMALRWQSPLSQCMWIRGRNSKRRLLENR